MTGLKPKYSIVVGLAGLALLLTLGYLFSPSSRQTNLGLVDSDKIVKAFHTYCADQTRQGRSLPPAVTLRELVLLGYLQPKDIAGFGATGVSLFPPALLDETHPQNILAQARLPGDGLVNVLLHDGSVQQTNQGKIKERLKNSGRKGEHPREP